MRVAVCISGALRTFAASAPHIQSFFGQVDYFGTFWSTDRGALAPKTPSTYLPFKAVSFPEQPQFPHGVEVPGSNIVLQNPSVRPMYAGLKKSFELLCQTVDHASTYDLIFRCRPDLWFQGSLVDFLDRMKEPKVYVPNHSQYHGYCDQFAGGPPHLMKHVFSTFDAFTAYDGPKVTLNGERILKWWLDHQGVPAAELPFEFKIYRTAFIGMKYEDIPRFSNAYRDK